MAADFFLSLCDTLISSFLKLFSLIIGLVQVFVDSFMVPIVSVLPDLSGFGPILHYAGLANSWVALDFGLMLLSSYFVFIAAVCLVKWILGLIPTVN
ncbi:MAG: hypothetical protein RR335_11260 [Eubacterium sp.]